MTACEEDLNFLWFALYLTNSLFSPTEPTLLFLPFFFFFWFLSGYSMLSSRSQFLLYKACSLDEIRSLRLCACLQGDGAFAFALQGAWWAMSPFSPTSGTIREKKVPMWDTSPMLPLTVADLWSPLVLIKLQARFLFVHARPYNSY